MKYLMYLLMAALLILAACGGDSGNGGSSQRQEGRSVPIPDLPVATIPESEFERVMNNQNMTCASIDGSECPAGITRIFIRLPQRPNDYGLCTGFMIDQDTMITNNHCINTTEECNGAEIIIYNRGAPQRTQCRRITRTEADFPEGDPRRSIDVTVIDVTTSYSGNTFDPASISSVPEVGDNYTAWVVDHTGWELGTNYTDSRITELPCPVVLVAETLPIFMDPCATVRGNSGSPVVNEEGDVVGIIWAGNSRFRSVDVPLEERRNLFGIFAVATERRFFFEGRPEEPTSDTTTGTTTGDVGTTATTTTGTTTGTTGTATTTTGGTNGTTTGTTNGTTNGGTNGTTNGTTNGGTTGGTTGGETAVTTGGNGNGETTGTTNGTTTGGAFSREVNGL